MTMEIEARGVPPVRYPLKEPQEGVPPVAWPLFDHSVREPDQRWRDGQVEVLRGLEIERKIEAGRTFHGQIRRLLTVKDMPGIHPDVAPRFDDERAIAHEPTGLHEFAPGINRRYRVP